MSNFWNVVGFTVKNKIRTKSFIVTTVIIAAIMSLGVNLPFIISQFTGDDAATESTVIGYVENEAPQVTDALTTYYNNLGEEADLQLAGYANEEALREAISEGEIRGYLIFEEQAGQAFPAVTYKAETLSGGSSVSLMSALQTVRNDIILEESGLTAEQRAALLEPINLNSTQISTETGTETVGGETGPSGLAMGFVYVVIILLFMGIFITSQLIATEVTSEKSSRVMEILVTSVAPLTQMFGKIFGMFLVGTMQIGTFILVFLINVMLPHNQEMLAGIDINLSELDPMLYVYAIIFYFGGYFLFATLFAAVGSIVSRTEDLAQALTPVTILSMAGFYIGIFGMTAPDSTLIQVASYIPFFAPFAMFLRVGLTDPALWEIALSIGLLLVSILIFGWLSAKIYRTGVLMYGKRPSWKEIRKAMKAYKI
ncbi:ABC transporter permease [Paenibacillus daejeonensis]|uniref:ABC transporter permease n=1 Tax=Paenibacillus daejeonensis TaxID=135193 RepID=UPI000363E0F0|nr:ABC transporter permease [Paenibacillus daejeonensis]